MDFHHIGIACKSIKKSIIPYKLIGYSLNKIALIAPIIDLKDEAYKLEGFNDYGDYVFRMDGFSMKNMLQEKSCLNIDLKALSSDYIPFMKKLEKEGYRIVYIPNFVPRRSCGNPELIQSFHEELYKNFGIPGFDQSQLLFSEEYFYDSSYHLQLDGVDKKTTIFKKQLKSYFSE